jgi:hypothetical protein
MLTKCILFMPSNRCRCSWRIISKTVQDRIKRWYNGDLSGLWSEVLFESSKSAKKKPKTSTDPHLYNIKRARQAIQDGHYRKAIQALSSSGLAPVSEIVKDDLLKHPQLPSPSVPSSPPPSSVRIEESCVLRALKTFPPGTAPGPSGLKVNHLKEAALCPSPARASAALQSLSKVTNILGSGLAPSEVFPHICGATLLAIRKKNGGLRPIAIGEVLRRLVSKCLSRMVSSEAACILSPLQVGVGVPAGAEAIVHSINSIQEDPSISPSQKWVLLLDFSNAFNSISRVNMFEEIRSQIPSLSSWFESCYGSPSYLHFGPYTINSVCGVQQGDPLGPLGFALTLHPIVERIKREVPHLLTNSWYLDDGTLCGSAEDLSSALSIIEEEGPSKGLHLNHLKSLLFIPKEDNSSNPLPSDIPVSRDGFDILGSPIGPPS